MARKTDRMAKAAVTLAAAALVEKGVDVAAKAAQNRRARRKGTALTKQVKKSAKGAANTVGRKAAELGSAVRKQVPALRKKAAKKLVRIAKAIEP